MTTKREAPPRRADRRRHPDPVSRAAARKGDTAPARPGRKRGRPAPSPGRESRAPRTGPQTAAAAKPNARRTPPKNASQAKARAKARKAKAPKVVRAPLRERLLLRLAALGKVDLRPRTLAAKVPFVVLIIGSLGVGLGITLWLSTDAAERSYQLGNLRAQNRALLQQKEALERDVLTAQSAPALAEAARDLGMIPTRDAAHLVQDPSGNWVVVGNPTPAEGSPAPPLNTKLPDDEPPAAPPAPPRSVEMPVRESPALGVPAMPLIPGPGTGGPEVLERVPGTLTPLGGQQLSVIPPVAPALPGTLIGPRPGPAPAAVVAPPGAVEQFSAPVPAAVPGELR